MTSLFFSPKSVYSHLCSVTGSSSSSFPLLSHLFSRESALFLPQLPDISLFCQQSPKALHSRARGYLSDLQRARCPKGVLISLSAFPSLPLHLFMAATKPLLFPLPLAQTKVIYPRLKHLPSISYGFSSSQIQYFPDLYIHSICKTFCIVYHS